MTRVKALKHLAAGKSVSVSGLAGSLKMDGLGIIRWMGTNTPASFLQMPVNGWSVNEGTGDY